MALVKQDRLRRIKIFGYAVFVKCSRTKPDDASAGIADGKHDTVAKTIINCVLVFVLVKYANRK